MLQAEALRLEQVIADTVAHSGLATRYHGLTIEMPGAVGEDLMRVHLSFDSLRDVEDGVLSNLVRAIEDAVSAIDDRYPSVRFAEAA